MNIKIINTKAEHAKGIYDLVRLAYRDTLDVVYGEEGITDGAVLQQIARFPEGQFVAITQDDPPLVVAMAATMIVSRPPTAPPLTWLEAMGGTGISKHDPNGQWLYGVEMAVLPDYRRHGIGTTLYQKRFELVKRLNLRGWYAGGSLMGYHRFQGQLSVAEYAEKVIKGELIDPTVTMQMHRGFKPTCFIPDYLPDEPDAGNGAVLIVWENPDYHE